MSVRFAVRLPRLSTPTSRTLIRSPSPGTGPAFAPRIVERAQDRAREDPVERVAEDRSRSGRPTRCGSDHDDGDRPRGRRSRAGRSGRSGAVSRKAWPTATSRHARTQHVERQQRAEDLGRDDPGRQPGRRLELDDQQRRRRATTSDGMRKSAASRRRPLNSWPSPGISADSAAAARRRCPSASCRAGSGWLARGARLLVADRAGGCRRGSLLVGGRRAWRRRAIDQPALITRRRVL